jgi:transposase
MDGTNPLPNDLTECHQLLVAAYRQSVQLEQQAAKAQRRVAESEQKVAELNRVLGETAASFEELKQEHAAVLDELAWYKRWAFGRRRERFREGAGQGHLFDLDPAAETEPEDSATAEEGVEVQGHRRRQKRPIDWDKLRQIHHEHDLSDEEKVCSCCGRTMDRIGEDVTRELEYEPPKLEAHIHTRPKYACRRCQDGVWAAPLPARPIPGGIAGPGLVTEVIVGKFGDHLPLYRLEDIVPFGRHSGPLRRIRFPKHDVRLGEVRGRTSLAALRPAT